MNKPPKSSEFTPQTVSTGALPASKRIYTSPAMAPAVKVPHREIALHETAKEPPVRVYDTSGPYTDTAQSINVDAGLSRNRLDWYGERGFETYQGREVTALDNGGAKGKYLARAFPKTYQPLRSKGDQPCTQLEFARAGIITEEMYFVAERENLGRRAALKDAQKTIDQGQSFGAQIQPILPQNLSVPRLPEAGRLFRPISIMANWNR